MIGFAYAGLAGLQLAGGLLQADAIKESAALNRQIAEMNAQYAELDAYNAEIDGYTAIGRYQKVIDDTLATQQLKLTTADVDVSYGSASSIQKETRFLGELNKMEMINRAEAKAMGYKFQASNIRLQGDMTQAQAKMKAGQVVSKGIMQAASTSLSGYGKGAFDDINMDFSSLNNIFGYGTEGASEFADMSETTASYLAMI